MPQSFFSSSFERLSGFGPSLLLSILRAPQTRRRRIVHPFSPVDALLATPYENYNAILDKSTNFRLSQSVFFDPPNGPSKAEAIVPSVVFPLTHLSTPTITTPPRGSPPLCLLNICFLREFAQGRDLSELTLDRGIFSQLFDPPCPCIPFCTPSSSSVNSSPRSSFDETG